LGGAAAAVDDSQMGTALPENYKVVRNGALRYWACKPTRLSARRTIQCLVGRTVGTSLFDTSGGEGAMLRNTKDLLGYALHATDGIIGGLKDFHFDDQSWVIRYLIVDTRTWLSSRKVLGHQFRSRGQARPARYF
jgi:hypothetical protein